MTLKKFPGCVKTLYAYLLTVTATFSSNMNLDKLVAASDMWTCGNFTKHVEYLSNTLTTQDVIGMFQDNVDSNTQ